MTTTVATTVAKAMKARARVATVVTAATVVATAVATVATAATVVATAVATAATVVATALATVATVATTADDTRSKEPCRKDRRTVELGQAARKAAVPRSLGAQGSGVTATLHAAQATK